MSLDVYLEMESFEKSVTVERIFIREDGQTKEISLTEWQERFPGREPFAVETDDGEMVYSANITHNLNKMAGDAGMYDHLWRPDEIGITKAAELVEPLRAGLALLKSDPSRFKKFNPENGWGTYEGLVAFVEKYLAACEKYPAAVVSVSR